MSEPTPKELFKELIDNREGRFALVASSDPSQSARAVPYDGFDDMWVFISGPDAANTVEQMIANGVPLFTSLQQAKAYFVSSAQGDSPRG
jgi:hypothetical protein